MANVRGMLARVAKLEAARQAPVSPIVALYGSIDAFGADTEGLDQRDFQQVIAALHRWERDGVYGRWHDRGHRVREQGL
jgi:hypothetical protein